MNAPAMAVTPHIILRRLACRWFLLGTDRRENEKPEMSWPTFVEYRLESHAHVGETKKPKEPMETDDFDCMMTISVGRMEPMLKKTGQPELDKNGVARHLWVTRDETRLEPLSNYGSFVRMMAARCGFSPKSLARWTEDEIMRIAAELARFVAIGTKNEPQPAKDWPNYPHGWQDAQAVAQAHGEEQGFWRESK